MLFIMSVMLCMADNGNFDIRNIGMKEGLKSECINDVVQDEKGYIWIASDAGVYRFDGHRFFKFDLGNSKLRSNVIYRLRYDKAKDELWIATALGLETIDGKTFTLDHIDPKVIPDHLKTYHIVAMKPGKNNTLWIVNRHVDIIRYHTDTGKIDLYNPKNTPGLGDSFCDVEEDGHGNLIIANYDIGLTRLNIATRKVSHFKHEQNNPSSLPDNMVWCLKRDKDGNLWAGTDNGLVLFDSRTGKITTFRHDPSDPKSLVGNSVRTIYQMNDGTVWVGCDDGGISVIRPSRLATILSGKNDFLNFTEEEESDVIRLTSPRVRSIYQDSYNNVWIGYFGSGIDFIGHDVKPFSNVGNPSGASEKSGHSSPSVYSILSNNDGSVWMGTSGELYLYRNNMVAEEHTIPSDRQILSITRYGDELLLGLENDSMILYHPGKRTSKKVSITYPETSVYSSLPLDNGDVLLGTTFGLYRYSGGSVKKVENVPHPVSALNIFSLLKDNDGRIWVGTFGDGLFVLDRNLRSIKHLNSDDGIIISNAVKHLFLDSRGWIWIAGQDGLCCVKDPHNFSQVDKYGYEQGLEDIHVRAINEDSWGNIWFSTNSGLSRWDKKTSNIENYDYRQGLPRTSFLNGATAIGGKDTILFSALDGMCIFSPKDIDVTRTIPPVYITELQFPDNMDKQGAILPISLQEKRIELPYYKNSFQVRFVMPDFYIFSALDYSYKMEGVDKDWHPIIDENLVAFNNLPPGKYTFSVRAKLRNQDWDQSAISSVEIVINPPLWLTWWAKLIYILAGLALTYAGLRFYRARMIRETRLEMERREAVNDKELNNERLRFFTNITHELRTSLTLIISSLEDLKADPTLNSDHRHRVDIIHRSSMRLLNLVNQILEFRKTVSHNRVLKVEYGEMTPIVSEMALRFRELNSNKEVEIEINVSKEIGKLFFDPEVVRIITNNFLSNALKYTATGKVVLTLRPVEIDGEKWAEISVSDTGVGIPSEALPHIFERYYQAKRKYQVSGTGIGLALVKSLSDLHHGKISVESTEGEGSVIRFAISMEEKYPDAIHIDEMEPRREESVEETIEEETDNQRPCMLIVEDNKEIRSYIAETFSEDFRIETASDGAAGLEKARRYIPDMIISDIMMPVMDGIEFCKEVKGDVATSHIPVVLLTAKDSLRDKEEGYESGADSYITKPFTACLLRNRIENILASRKKLAGYFMNNIADHSYSARPAETTVSAETSNDSDNKERSEDVVNLVVNKLDEEFMTRLNTLISEHISDENLDMSFIQDKMNMSYSTFYRKIKALTGFSGNEYIRKRRLNHAQTLLAEGKSVTETAWECGFNDMVYFRKCFKKEFGITPSEYAKSLK